MKKMLAVCCALGALLSMETQAWKRAVDDVMMEVVAVAQKEYEEGLSKGIAAVMEKTGDVKDLSFEQKQVYLKDQFKDVVAKAVERLDDRWLGVIEAADNAGAAGAVWGALTNGGDFWGPVQGAAANNNNFGGFTQSYLECLNLAAISKSLVEGKLGDAYVKLLQGVAKGFIGDKLNLGDDLANVNGPGQAQCDRFNKMDFQVGTGSFNRLEAELSGKEDDQKKVEAVVNFFEKVAANGWRLQEVNSVNELGYMNSLILFCQLMGLLPKEGSQYTAGGATVDADRPFLVEYEPNTPKKLAYKYELSTEIKDRILSIAIDLLAHVIKTGR